MENITSGADYAQVLIDNIQNTENSLPPEEQMSPTLLECWFDEIKHNADQTYADYIMGNRDSYLFDEVEMTTMFEVAKTNYIQNIINEMVDKDLLDVGIDENGDIVYSASEKGKEVLKNNLK